MEDNRPPQDESESWHPKKETAKSGFLTAWFNRHQEITPTPQEREASKEEDEDDETEPSPAKRFRRFFRRMFKHLVEPTAHSPENIPRLFSLTGAVEQQPSISPEAPADVAPEPEHVWQRTEQPQPNVAADTTAGPVETASRPLEPYRRPLFEQQTPASSYEPLTREGSEERTTTRTAETTEPTVVERHEIDRNAGATMALLGAEFFARRRADRKIDRKLTREIKTLEQQVEKGKDAQVRLEQVIAKQPEQVIAAAPAERVRPTVEFQRPQPVPEQVQTVPEKQPVATERIISREATPNHARLAEKDVQPSVLLEKVAEAAEHNAPIERAYERRQEIKDEASMPMAAGGASAVGEILSRTAPMPSPTNLSVQQHATRQRVSAAQPLKDQPMYRNAVTTGVGGALVIIIFAVLAYFLTK